MDQNIVIEIVEFKLMSGVDEAAFIEIVNALEENFHSRQNGFISTELTKGKDGQWIMIQHWNSMEDAKEVIKAMMKTPVTEDFRQVLDPKSVKMLLLEHVLTWSK